MTISQKTSQSNKPILLLEGDEAEFSPPLDLTQYSNINDQFFLSRKRLYMSAKTLGMDVVCVTRDPLRRITPVPEEIHNRPVVVYGSIQFVRDIKQPLMPGAYGYSGCDWVNFSANVPRSLWLNDASIMVTWADLRANFMFWADTLGSSHIFVRPASDKKTFAGQLLGWSTHDYELESIDLSSSVIGTTMCVISVAKTIYSEIRSVIVDRKIVAMTKYPHYTSSSSNFLHVSVDDEKNAQKAINSLTALDWQPDSCYTCDVALTPNGAKIVELNSFSCAGLYDCETDLVLAAVADQAVRDFELP